MHTYLVSTVFVVVAISLFAYMFSSFTESTFPIKNQPFDTSQKIKENLTSTSLDLGANTSKIDVETKPKTIPKVIINEIMYNPVLNDKNKEWVEIYNVGDDVDLNGWEFIVDNVTHKLTFFSDSLLKNGSYGVIVSNATTFLLEYPKYDGMLIRSSFSLKNDKGRIAIVDNGKIIDVVEYDKLLGANGNGKTLERKIDSWLESYVDGGTPGKENSVYSKEKIFSENLTTQNNETNLTIVNKTLTQNITQPPENITEENTTQPENITEENVTEQPIVILITKVQIADNEFVELYNPADFDVNLSGWYLSYFSSEKNWNDSYRNWRFLTNATIKAKGFFLINVYNSTHLNPDWTLLTVGGTPYSSGQLSNTAGSIAIFKFNPREKSIEEVREGKVDAVGWGNVSFVYENFPAKVPKKGEILNRVSLIDTNDNSQDFNVTVLS